MSELKTNWGLPAWLRSALGINQAGELYSPRLGEVIVPVAIVAAEPSSSSEGAAAAAGANAYTLYAVTSAAGAGPFPNFQVWNPADSGVDAHLTVLRSASNTAGTASGPTELFRHNAALATASFSPVPKASNAPGSPLQGRFEHSAVNIGTSIGRGQSTPAADGQTGNMADWIMDRNYPFIIKPGSGLHVRGGVFAYGLLIHMEWTEVATS